MDKDALRDKTIRSKSAEYSVHNLIGAGRFSRVYRATDTATGNAVVIKVLNSVNMEEHLRCSLYMQELSLLNRLKSSPVRERYVDLRDVIQLNTGVICFVMEMLGATLHAVMCNVGTLPLSVCRLIVRQIAQGTYTYMRCAKGWANVDEKYQLEAVTLGRWSIKIFIPNNKKSKCGEI
jgi:serine/threonine protein kinase